MIQLPAHTYLEQQGVPYTRQSFASSTPKGAAQVASALGYAPGQMVKTLIFEVDTGEKVLVMVGGDQNAISGHLKKAIGSRNIKMAAPAVVKATCGYEVGSIPPFHWQPPGFRSFVDTALLRYDVLGVGAGQWGEEILITPTHLVGAAQAIVVNLTDRTRAVFATGGPDSGPGIACPS
jgi:Cys-tRNA(Pro)/Cys-tRNA(Cys) deacylase